MAPLAQILVDHWCCHQSSCSEALSHEFVPRLYLVWFVTSLLPQQYDVICSYGYLGVVSVCLESPVSPLDASLMKMTVVDPDRPDPTLKSIPDGLCVMVLTRSLMQGNLPPAESAVLPPIAPPSESPKAVLPE